MDKFKLSCAAKNRSYKIVSVEVLDSKLLSHLKNIDFVEGQTIEVLFNNFGKDSYIVKINHIKFAIDKKICDSTWVVYA